MMRKVIALTVTMVVALPAIAQAPIQALEEPAPYVDSKRMSEPFFNVTAQNGLEWVEQCERPADKSESERRVIACSAFLSGARALATNQPDKFCTLTLNNLHKGGLFDVSLYAARQKPALPISSIMTLIFSGLAPLPCPQPK